MLASKAAALGVCLLLGALGLARVGRCEVFLEEGNVVRSIESVLTGSEGIAVDLDGNIWVSDTQHHVIRKFSRGKVPLAVYGREARAGSADGSPVDARFALPTNLAIDRNGDVLVADGAEQDGAVIVGPTRIRRIDHRTGQVTTVADLITGVDARSMLDVATGLTEDEGTLNGVEIGDLAAHPGGDIYVSATDIGSQRANQFLIRVRGSTATAIATTSAIPEPDNTGSRGVAVDRDGNVFTAFTDTVLADGLFDGLYRFGTDGGVTRHRTLGDVGTVRAMATGFGTNLYLVTERLFDVGVTSTAVPDAPVQELLIAQPGGSISFVREVAAGPLGDVYALSSRLVQAGSATTFLAKVDVFRGVDTPIGADAADVTPPTVSIEGPVQAFEILDAPGQVEVSASDDAGIVRVQLRLDERPFGPELAEPPFALDIDPALLRVGRHLLYAVARDGAGNPAVSLVLPFFSKGGRPNPDGEILIPDEGLFVPPATRLRPPFGISTDAQGNVYTTFGTLVTGIDFRGEVVATFGSLAAGLSDGPAASARFTDLRGLGRDSAGRLVVVDTPGGIGPYVRRLDLVSGQVQTLIQLSPSSGIDESAVWNVQTATFDNLTTDPICGIGFPCLLGVGDALDPAGAPDGDILVSGNGRTDIPDSLLYLMRLSGTPSRHRAIARSGVAIPEFPAGGARGVAVDPQGDIYTSFPVLSGGQSVEVILRFPGAFPFPVAPGPSGVLITPRKLQGMDADSDGRVYVAVHAGLGEPGSVAVVRDEGTGDIDDNLLALLDRQVLDLPHDVAVDGEGNVYVASTEQRFFGNLGIEIGRVTRFGAALTGLAPRDSDGDGVSDDGDDSGYAGDAFCVGGATSSCDDNCPDLANAPQVDVDLDAIGDLCDPIVTPEPASLALWLAALGGLTALSRARRASAAQRPRAARSGALEPS